jgi:hypothetical protein
MIHVTIRIVRELVLVIYNRLSLFLGLFIKYRRDLLSMRLIFSLGSMTYERINETLNSCYLSDLFLV